MRVGLGSDELSRFVERRLEEEGVGLEYLDRRDDPRPVHSVIVVDESRQTRTIFFDSDGASRARVDWPPDDVIAPRGCCLWTISGSRE